MKTRLIVLAGMILATALGQALATTLDELNGDLTKLVAAASPAVVEIRVEKVVPTRPNLPNMWNFQTEPSVPLQPGEETWKTVESVGTGFVIDPSGYILTTNDVVDGAKKIMVKFPCGEEVEGTPGGRDYGAGVAVIRVQKTGLAALPLGDSDSLRLGTLVISINSQAGLENTVALGIVAGLNRSLGTLVGNAIQISGTVGPGASGGPVLDSSGRVVAVTYAMLSPSGSALPFNYPSIILQGEGPRMLIEELGDLDAQQARNEANRAQIESDLAKKMMALAQAQFEQGRANSEDFLKKKAQADLAMSQLEDKRIDLEKLLKTRELWNGNEGAFTMPYGQMITETSRTSGSSGFAIPINPIKRTLDDLKTGRDVRADQGGWLGVELGEKNSRVVLKSVTPDSPAARGGLKEGDILIFAGGREVKSTEGLSNYIKRLPPGTGAPLTIEREGKRIEINVTIDKRPEPDEQKRLSGSNYVPRIRLPSPMTPVAGLSISLSNAGISEVAKKLAEASGVSVIVVEPEKIKKKVTVQLKSTTLGKALDVICRTLGCACKKDGEAYVIRPK